MKTLCCSVLSWHETAGLVSTQRKQTTVNYKSGRHTVALYVALQEQKEQGGNRLETALSFARKVKNFTFPVRMFAKSRHRH